MSCQNMPDNPINGLLTYVANLTHLRAEYRSIFAEGYKDDSITKIHYIITKLNTIDEQLQQWNSRLPLDFLSINRPRHNYNAIMKDESLGINRERSEAIKHEPLPARPKEGTDLIAENIMNDFRSARMLCQDSMVRCIDWLPPESQHAKYVSLKKQAKTTCAALAKQITTSKPIAAKSSRESKPFLKAKLHANIGISADTAIRSYAIVEPMLISHQVKIEEQ